MVELDFNAIERKWQKKWYDAKLHEGNRDENNPKKYLLHFAYPGISGYLHVGHMRGFTYSDIFTRYKRMKGYNVCFPAGFHASGIPSVSVAKKVKDGVPEMLEYLKNNGCPPDVIPTLADPLKVVEYFSHIYEEYWKEFGFLIDYRRLTTTIDDGYKKFIDWQFRKLGEKGLLITKPYFAPFCPACGPVAVDKSETDISKGGGAETQEFTVLKFTLDDGTILPAATLRPETIFGVTNIWLNPDVEYVKVKLDNGEAWLVSPQAARKLDLQKVGVVITGEMVKGSELVGKSCAAPYVERKVPIIAGPFANPNFATGVVMSVPAHAPYDWMALKDSGADAGGVEPITIIIDVEGYKDAGATVVATQPKGAKRTEGVPAREACERLGVRDQHDTAKLDEATDEVYKKEFHTGRLNAKCGRFAGLKISSIKDQVKNELKTRGLADAFMQFSEEVVCRCGEQVQIKRIPDQWFVRYSDKKLTEAAKEQVGRMSIFPAEYKREMPSVLDWFNDRPCIRKGAWLGTEFPFKEGWTIEPISDSTLYSAYYIVSNYVNEGRLAPAELTEEFFDYVYLGRGKPASAIWGEVRRDFLYWYPVDVNLGGKEHKTVHFPVYLMNHVALMPPEMWPKGIFVNWWVTQKAGAKISKSKGGAEPVPGAIAHYGVDPLRLYYSHIGSPHIDIEWDREAVNRYRSRVLRNFDIVCRIAGMDEGAPQPIDDWLQDRFNIRVRTMNESMDAYDLRIAATEAFYEIPNDLSWYMRRGGSNRKLLIDVASKWVRMMAPITPHVSEELWNILGNDSFAAQADFPAYDESVKPGIACAGERLLLDVMADVAEIKKVTGIDAKRIILYTSQGWKQKLLLRSLDLVESGERPNPGVVIKEAMQDPEMRPHAQAIPKFVPAALADLMRTSDEDKARYRSGLDEAAYLKEAVGFLKSEFGCEVEVYAGDDPTAYDPAGKIRAAKPLKPAIYVE